MKYIIAVFGMFILIILGIILLTRDNPKQSKTPAASSIELTDYKNNTAATLIYTVEGPIVAEENHQSIRIAIGVNSRRVEVTRGYEGDVEKSQIYGNNPEAFEAFLRALAMAGFNRKRESKVDPEGICPTGNRSSYQLLDGRDKVVDSWTSSCAAGTFGGSLALTIQLFKAQIPDYGQITSGANVGGSGSGGGTGLVL